MDYMKMLLIYMAATFSLAVQSTTAPAVTPAAPETTAIVQQAEQTAQVIQGVTYTPGPATETPRPVPQITPNRKYHNLASGAKGSEVRKLQERLIELGYLAEGAADGVYGRQTAKAVKKFQAYNGLTQDGIAGRTTQTYLFENPDILPFPQETPTAEATDTPEATPETTPTAAPTEKPTATPTEKPTEAPTATPTEKPTEAPTATPTEKPTETPTEKPTEAPTATPTQKPTEAPTEEPTSDPGMSVEEIDLTQIAFTEVDGSVAYNESGAPLEWVTVEDGVKVTRKPRLQEQEGRIRVSLEDLAACIETWNLTDDGTVVLEAEGHTLGLYNEDAGLAATADGIELNPAADDFVFGDGLFIDAAFLARALGGEALWDVEEQTLMLRFPEK